MAFVLPDIDTSEFTEFGARARRRTIPSISWVSRSKPTARKSQFQVEQRAIYKGHDVTALVKSVGMPVNVVVAGSLDKLKNSRRPIARCWKRTDLIDSESGEDDHPHWTVQTRFYWNQKFPAGKTVVFEQSYQPVTGQAFFSDRNSPPNRQPAIFPMARITASMRRRVAQSKNNSRSPRRTDTGKRRACCTR